MPIEINTPEKLNALLPKPKEVTSSELQQVANNFQEQMGAAIDGQPSSCKMYDTCIPTQIFQQNLVPGRKCLAIDSGGTGPKISFFEVNTEGELQLIKDDSGNEMQHEGQFNES